MADTSNFGILTNTSNIYDAVDNRNAATTEILFDSKYNNGTAIKAVGANQLMFDTGVIPAGTFSGVYDIGIFYDSLDNSTQGQPLMRWAIYEDGVLMPEDTSIFNSGVMYEYDLNTVDNVSTYGFHYTIKLKAASTYQIKITTSGSISTRTAILDYVSLARMAENSMAWGRPMAMNAGTRNAGKTDTLDDIGTQLVCDVIYGQVNGPWVAGTDYGALGYTYTPPFKKIAGAFPVVTTETGGSNVGAGLLNCTVDLYDLPNNQVRVNIRNVGSTNLSYTGTFYVRIFVVGFI